MASTYVVRHGDTLWSIASRNGITLAKLMSMNPSLAGAKYNGGNLIWAGDRVNLSPVSSSSSSSKAAVRAPSGGAPTPNPIRPSIEQTLEQKLISMPGAERDAYAALSVLFNSYGLQSLAPKILTYLQNGFGSDTISVMLQQTPEYRARFAGNDQRVARGLQVLTPAEYLSTEASYRQLIQAGGLDPSFMSSNNYSEWIGKDISPTEMQSRVNLAVQATTQAPPSVQQAFSQLGFHAGDLASYFLNDNVAPPVLQQKLNQAQIIGAGLQQGLQVNSDNAMKYAKEGVTYQQAIAGYGKEAQVLPAALRLSDIYKQQQVYNGGTAEAEFLGNDGNATNRRNALGRQEEATFSGQGGAGKDSFKQQTQGAPGF